MSHTDQQQECGASRVSLYEDITGKIVKELEAGTAPWVKPWASSKAPLGMPRSASTQKFYSGVNVLILWMAVIEHGYGAQEWLTFRQAQGLGGTIRKGEHGTTICYADSFIPKGERERAREQGEDHEAGQKSSGRDDFRPNAVPFLKRFTVFNVEQCDGLPAHIRPIPPTLSEIALCPDAEHLITATRARIVEGAGEAFYHRGDDLIRIPSRETFVSTSDFYCTVLHELGHWTAHPTRLGRDLQNRFGSEAYAREELIAELTSAFLCAHLGIVPQVRHVDYLGHWLQTLKSDPRAIFHAASQASKASDFILAFRHPEQPPA